MDLSCLISAPAGWVEVPLGPALLFIGLSAPLLLGMSLSTCSTTTAAQPG